MPIPDAAAAVTEVCSSPAATAHALTTAPEPEGQAEPASPEYTAAPLPSPPEPQAPEPVEFVRPAYRLFSPGTIGVVALLAGPVGAFTLLTVNYWRLGRRHAAGVTALVGTVVVVALGMVGGVLPSTGSACVVGLPAFLALWWAAHSLQGDAYETHIKQGGRRASGWAAAGYAVVGFLIFVPVLFILVAGANVAFDAGYGPKIDLGHGQEVYYAKGATEADARALGNFLREAGFFDDENPAAVRVSRDGNRTVISFIVQARAVHDVEAQDTLRQIGRQASQEVFGGRPVVVEMCDGEFKVKKRL
jgi:hypothetical protein